MTPLRQQMIDAMQVRGLAVRTQQAYVDALARMARHFGCSPAQLDAAQIEAYMLHLSRERGRSFSTINHVASASRFLFRHVLKREDRGLERRPQRGIGQRHQPVAVALGIAHMHPSALVTKGTHQRRIAA